MALNDSTTTAPDKITGQKNIVAFRACGIENRSVDQFDISPGICSTLSNVHDESSSIMHILLNNMLYSKLNGKILIIILEITLTEQSLLLQ